jgi:hypothetical protein
MSHCSEDVRLRDIVVDLERGFWFCDMQQIASRFMVFLCFQWSRLGVFGKHVTEMSLATLLSPGCRYTHSQILQEH